MTTPDFDALRAQFVKLLTVDSETQDRRRRDFNQALFFPEGISVWDRIDLSMVLEKFDRAVKGLGQR